MNEESLLVEMAIRGGVDAFNQLMKTWYKRIFNFTFRYLASYDEASEITQQAFIKAYQSIGNLKDPHKFKSWLYIIASNECRAFSRKSTMHPVSSIYDTYLSETEPWQRHRTTDNPERGLVQQQQKDLLSKALSKIPEEQRIVIIMKEYEGFTFHEIAQILSLSENTIKSRMYYGLNALRKILTKWNIDKEAIQYDS